MKTSILLALGLSVAFGLVSWGLQPPSDPMAGRIVFEKQGCIGCHAIDGFGGQVGPDLGREKFFGSFYDLAARLWNHAPQMAIQAEYRGQAWSTLTSAELEQLISYLFYLRYLGEPGQVSRGKELLQEKGCLVCHRIGPQGPREGSELADLIAYLYFSDFQPPPGEPQAGQGVFQAKSCANCHAPGEAVEFEKLIQLETPTDLVRTMWNHVPLMRELILTMNLEWPELTAEDLRNLYPEFDTARYQKAL